MIADKLREPTGTVDPRRLIEGRVDLRHAGQQQDGAESQQDPDSDEANRRERPVEVAKPGTGDRAEADGLEDLVDQAREGQQPAPDDPGRNERDDLGQEQNGPGYRSEPPGRHTVDHARDDKTEATGMKLKNTTSRNALKMVPSRSGTSRTVT